ncbi:YdcF family protein [Candidatus Dojkabacteria bacterium]|nr:YdcF family protein [Candidatus Dojkabacteria bacterium]
MKKYTKILKISALVLGIATLAFLISGPILVYRGKYQIYTKIDDVEKTRVGIVFGAGVKPTGEPSDMLEDRLKLAYDLYENDKIEKIVVSGDNRFSHYNEPQAMYNYLVRKGVNNEDIVQDFAGRRTYDTCYRAKEIFGIDEALLISQGYHLPRALFLCNKMGIESTGYSATLRTYENEPQYKIREIIAIYWSVIDIYIRKPTPVLGEEIEI